MIKCKFCARLNASRLTVTEDAIFSYSVADDGEIIEPGELCESFHRDHVVCEECGRKQPHLEINWEQDRARVVLKKETAHDD